MSPGLIFSIGSFALIHLASVIWFAATMKSKVGEIADDLSLLRSSTHDELGEIKKQLERVNETLSSQGQDVARLQGRLDAVS